MKRLVLTTTIITSLVIVMFAFSPKPRAQNTKHLNLEAAFTQKDAPIQIKSLTHTLQFYYGSATVENVSQQTIRSVTFGVLLHEVGSDWSKPILASSREIATNIDPGKSRSVDIEDASPSAIRQKASELKSMVVDVEFGILGVQFADGSTWQYDWQDEGAFSSQNTPGTKKVSFRPIRDCNELASLLANFPAPSSPFPISSSTAKASTIQ